MEPTKPDGQKPWEKIRAAAGAVSIESAVLAAGASYQMLFRLATYVVSYDHTFLLASALTFLRHGKLATLIVNTADLSQPLFAMVTHWPPGFSLVVAGLVKIVGNPHVAMVGFDLIFMALFFAACGRLLSLMGPVLRRPERILFAFTVAFVAPSYLEYFTNVASLALFVWALILILPGRDGRPPSGLACGSAGALLGSMIGMRYAAVPASIIPLFVLAVSDGRERGGRMRSLAAAAGWALAIAPFILWKAVIVPKSHLPSLSPGGGWYPRNLLRFHAFGADALFGKLLTEIFPASTYHAAPEINVAQYVARHLLSLLVLACSFAGIRALVRDSRSSPEGALIRRFFAAGGAASAATIGMLMALALRVAPQVGLQNWVYVEEARYFNVCLLFILFGAAYLAGIRARSPVMRVMKVAVLSAFVLADVAWVSRVPSVWRQWMAGAAGPVGEMPFINAGNFVPEFRALMIPGAQNVALEFGRTGYLTWQRQALVTTLDCPAGLVEREGQQIHSSRSVSVVAFVSKNAELAYQDAFEKFCRENSGEKEAISGFSACRVSLRAGS